MAKDFKRLNIKSAVKARESADLTATHLTTMDFGQIVPLWKSELIPGDSFNVEGNFFSRMAPLVKPTYGKFYFKTIEIFVPYYQVCDGIDAWMTGRKNWEGEVTTSRWTTRTNILRLFIVNTDLTDDVSAADVGTGAWYDFTYIDNNGTTKYKKFKNKGKYFIKILNSLGYTIPENGDLQTNSTWYNGYGAENISVLPLLAFAKGYNDWMSQSQRYNTSILSKLLKCIRHNVNIMSGGSYLYNTADNIVTVSGLFTILNSIVLSYENDYFTSAWQYPNAPITGEYYDPSKTTPEGHLNIDALLSADNGDEHTGLVDEFYNPNIQFNLTTDEEGVVDGTITTTIAQRSLDWLKAFDDWVRRNNYSGSRSVQQVYSRFGIKTEDYKSNYAHLIDKQTMPIQVGDVTALAQDYVGAGNAANIELGDYAGKGIMSGGNKFSYKASDYGMLLVYGWYTVAPMNVYGEDKDIQRNTPLDYYTPEFDGIGPEAISVDEVFVNPRETTTTPGNAVFGFTERYNSYRYGKDRITGDFRKMTLASGTYATTGTEMNTWHTGRMLNALRAAGTLVAQNPGFNTLPQTDSEYNRIFSITDGSVDHFYMTAQFKVNAVRPMLSLNQVPRLGEGDTEVPRNGNEIN